MEIIKWYLATDFLSETYIKRRGGGRYTQLFPLANIKPLKKIRGIHVMPMTQNLFLFHTFFKSLVCRIGINKTGFTFKHTIYDQNHPPKNTPENAFQLHWKMKTSQVKSYFCLKLSGKQWSSAKLQIATRAEHKITAQKRTELLHYQL